MTMRKSALKSGSPGAAAVGGSPLGSPDAERVPKVPRVGDGVPPPVVDFPFRGGGGSPGAGGDSSPGAGGVLAGSAAGPPPGFVAAAVDRWPGGFGVGAVEGGGLERADGTIAGHGETQERAAEEERRGKGVRAEVEFQGGVGSAGKGGKGGWQDTGFRGGSDPWGGWREKSLSEQVPILESPPEFAGKQSG